MQTNCASWKGKQKRDILWVSLFFCWGGAGIGACSYLKRSDVPGKRLKRTFQAVSGTQ
mgnify:CR=1 FL=1